MAFIAYNYSLMQHEDYFKRILQRDYSKSLFVSNMLTIIDMPIYHHHIFATGALYVSSIGSMSASLVRAALADAPDASASCLSGTPSDAILLRFWPRLFLASPLTAWVDAFG
jgi:hypothetical protein